MNSGIDNSVRHIYIDSWPLGIALCVIAGFTFLCVETYVDHKYPKPIPVQPEKTP